MKRWLCALTVLCALLMSAAAFAAEDVCYVSNVAKEDGVTTGCSYLCLKVPVDSEAQVILTLTGENGRTVYQRDFGVCSGSFRTEDIYLKLTGSSTIYNVTLQVGDRVYCFPVERVTGRLSGTAGCTAGVPLTEMSGVDGWRMATLLPVKDGETTVPVIAGGAYEVGEATFTVRNGKLTVSVTLDDAVDGAVESAKVYVAADAQTAAQLGRSQFSGVSGKLDRALDLGGAKYVAVFVKLSLAFDPAGAPAAQEETGEEQLTLWQKLLENSPSVG